MLIIFQTILEKTLDYSSWECCKLVKDIENLHHIELKNETIQFDSNAACKTCLEACNAKQNESSEKSVENGKW